MRGTFTGPAESAYSFDHQAAWDRLRAEEKRKEMDHQQRVAAWAMKRLAGETYESLEALREAIMRRADEEGYLLSEQACRAIYFASVHLWAGVVDRSITQGRLRVSLEPHRVSFVAA